MVGVLRDGEEADLAPQPGVADIERLARDAAHGPRVEVQLSGDLDELRPSVGAASTASRRSRSPTRCGTPAMRPGSTSASRARTTACG